MFGWYIGMVPLQPSFSSGSSFSSRFLHLTMLKTYALMLNKQAYMLCGLPHVLREIADETVKALVGCLVITIFLAMTTTTVIDVAYASAGVRVTLALTSKLTSSTPADPCPTDASVTPFVQSEKYVQLLNGASRSQPPSSWTGVRGGARRSVGVGRGGVWPTQCPPTSWKVQHADSRHAGTLRRSVLVSRYQLPVQFFCSAPLRFDHYLPWRDCLPFWAFNFVLFRYSSGVRTIMAFFRIRYDLEDRHLADAWFRQARRPYIQYAADWRDLPGFVHRGLHVVVPSVHWSNVPWPSQAPLPFCLHLVWRNALFSSAPGLSSGPDTFASSCCARTYDFVLDGLVHTAWKSGLGHVELVLDDLILAHWRQAWQAHLGQVSVELLVRSIYIPPRALMWNLVYCHHTVFRLVGFASRALDHCDGPPGHHCPKREGQHWFLLPLPCHRLHLATLSLIFPVFLAWRCALHAPVLRCHREIFATLEAGTCAGSRARNFYTFQFALWYFSFLYYRRLVSHCIELTTSSLTEFGRPTRNFRSRDAERKIFCTHCPVWCSQQLALQFWRPVASTHICHRVCSRDTPVRARTWSPPDADTDIPLHRKACWNQHSWENPHVRVENVFDVLSV